MGINSGSGSTRGRIGGDYQDETGWDMTEKEKQYQGVIVVSGDKKDRTLLYSAEYYEPGMREIFDQSVRDKKTIEGKLVVESLWLDEPVDLITIMRRGGEILKRRYN